MNLVEQIRIPDWLSEDMARTAWSFRLMMSGFLCLAAGIVTWTTFTGETALTVAYPMFAFISSALLGVGLIRSGGLNVPVALGTLVAVFGASFWLTSVLKGDLEAGSWERATMGLYFVGLIAIVWTMSTFAQVLVAIQRREIHTFGAYCLGFVSLIGMFGVPSLYVYGLSVLIGRPLG